MPINAIIAETLRLLRELASVPSIRTAALFLLPYAGVLIGLDVAARYGELTGADLPRQFFLSYDRGFGEWFEYSLTTAVAVMLYVMWRRERIALYLANAVLFLWLTLDNALEFHERFGHALENLLPTMELPFAVHDIGEALSMIVIGGFWLAALWRCVQGAQLRPAIYALLLAGCIAGAAFFGIAVDIMTAWDGDATALLEAETFVEDAGEFAMICLAFLAMVGIYDLEKARHLREQDARPAPEPLVTT